MNGLTSAWHFIWLQLAERLASSIGCWSVARANATSSSGRIGWVRDRPAAFGAGGGQCRRRGLGQTVLTPVGFADACWCSPSFAVRFLSRSPRRTLRKKINFDCFSKNLFKVGQCNRIWTRGLERRILPHNLFDINFRFVCSENAGIFEPFHFSFTCITLCFVYFCISTIYSK